ncbi:conserved Plasmodium protein, unknown function [Plasmodium relictum]|uniref:Uncharacterized protein n=1 Tax=Plasmodium relictum TaxID=85471 RepID=A0A1J1H5M0_PLARL|nr:conserved Plasmodium protein, unknown function [Plasmodium relictum]CRH00207.1 conserved Plasmodium protein, unknown function [Plasmodium relictum]
MLANYNEIKKLFNYYIREYYYQKSKGTYFVYIKKPGLLFTSLKFYKRKKTYFPNIYDWYFDNLSDLKQNKDILNYENYYNIKNIYSYKINKEKIKTENYVETNNIYINDSEENLKNIYKTSNLYFNINPVYLSKICLYDLNDYNILFSNNYYDAFIHFYYSIISYKINLNDIRIFPNLKILIGHIKNLSNIINDELIKNTYFYLIKQKKVYDEKYLYNIFLSIYTIMLDNSPFYLFVDNKEQFINILNFINKDDIKNMFESVIPFPYYLVVDNSVNIYNLQSFNIFLKKILNENKKNIFSSEKKRNIFVCPENNLNPFSYNTNNNSYINSNTISCNNISGNHINSNNISSSHINRNNINNSNVSSNNINSNNKDKYIHEQTKYNCENEKISERRMSNAKNEKIYFFKLIKIFVTKPNYRFKEKK